jgi:glyoxylase-like metal-dependent hydrolase (beta-lactamase superfamily II)
MLDGGAMFGVIPKSLWNKVYPANEFNLCNLSMRCLLIEAGDHLVLIDTGIGNKQSEKFFSYYYLNGEASLENSLSNAGFSKSDITDVILTHLHFDHCGGAVERISDEKFTVSFPKARYWISEPQWQWAQHPNLQEKASFLSENFQPIASSGQLNFIAQEGEFLPGISLRMYNGHSQGLLVPFIDTGKQTLVYVNDLMPTAAHIPASWVCGYDTQPLVSMNERSAFLEEAFNENYVLFFEHDIYHECCILKNTEKGIRMDEDFLLKEILHQ